MSPGKRPKLSLITTDLAPTYSGSTSSRNAVKPDATATPTTLNTFTNAFDLTYRPSPASALPSPGGLLQRRTSGHPASPTTKLSERPYNLNLPFGVRSILKNSPLPRDARRPSTCSASASPRTSRRVFFQPPKRVTFRTTLEDEIITKSYVMRHADLSSSDEETNSSEGGDSSRTSSEEGEDEIEERGILVDDISPRGRRKRKLMTISDMSARELNRGRDERSRSTSERRTKRKKRMWEWTLESASPKNAPSPNNREDGEEKKTSVVENASASEAKQGDTSTESSCRAEKTEDEEGQ